MAEDLRVMILHGQLIGQDQIDESMDARDSDSMLHDLKNLLTAIAAMTVRSQTALKGEDTPGQVAARAALDEISTQVGETIRVMRGESPCQMDGQLKGGVDVDDHATEHEVALGQLLGGADRFKVNSQNTEGRTIVDMDETDLLRVLVGMVRQAESGCSGHGSLRLDVEARATHGPTPMRSSVLPPRHYAQLRVSCIDCGAEELERTKSAQLAPVSLLRSLSAVEPLLAEARGGLRVVQQLRACPAVEVMLPARAR